jgi:hypothetical protein
MTIDFPNPPDPAEPRRTGHRWIDLIVALSALSISVASILVAKHTSDTMERLAHASFWPFLQLGSGNAGDNGEHEIAFGVENVGTGPARIHSFEVQVDGRPLPHGGHLLTNMLHACCEAEFNAAIERNGGDIIAVYGSEVSSPVSRRFLAPNHDVTAVRWPRNEANAAVWTALDMARQHGRITMSTCYCSVFDECWIARSDVFPPEQVDSCTPHDASSNATKAPTRSSAE